MAFAIESLSIFVRKLLAFIVYSNKEILLLDNRDSFTYNLVHLLKSLHAVPRILDSLKYIDNEVVKFEKILFSPGPGIPDHFPAMKSILSNYQSKQSILGICLGHQAIAEVFNSELINLKSTLHGISSKVNILDKTETLFTGLPNQIEVGHYHSWVVNPDTISEEIVVTSVDSDNNIMSLRHVEFDVKGIQFHPESILTPFGKTILKNWLNKD